ncbi:MAG TPA: hypothetical protein VHZ73_07930 [Vicinamibacterales bacterium]|jgi:hypothetical protein|nr:hypothetical protein [Vicinamibacterales bacterium]
MRALVASAMAVFLLPQVAAAQQQRPLATEDPEPLGQGRVRIEAGVSAAQDAVYPLSGLTGNLLRVPLVGLTFALGPAAELEITGGPYDRLQITSSDPSAPRAGIMHVSGNTTHDVDDLVVATKVRIVEEEGSRPALGVLFAVRLPNSKPASGLGQDTTDFSFAGLAGKTFARVRLAANVGVTIMSEPLNVLKQNDVATYGLSSAIRVTPWSTIVGEVNGHISTRDGAPPIGTESRGVARVGARLGSGATRFDAAVGFGLTPTTPTVEATAGVTCVLK